MVITIDRIEGKIAVCETEDRKILNVEKSQLPAEAKEGDVLKKDEGFYIIDREATQARKDRMKSFFNELLK